MSEYKAGLHKEVSAIFNGVSLPKDDGAQQPSAVPAPGHQDSIATKSPAQKGFTKLIKKLAKDYIAPKPQQPSAQLPAKEAPAKQPKADTAIKTTGLILWQRTLGQIKNKLFATKPGVSTTKQRMMVILAPALFIVLISMFIRAFSTPSQKITGPGTSGPVKAVAASSDSEADWQVPNPYPTTLRDPMQFSSATSQTGTGGLIVKGIVYSEDNPSAVIGDQIVHQGDKILDVAITKINENSVEFEANGKKWTQNVQR